MDKPLNKKVQFVKIKQESGITCSFACRVKKFGDTESVVVIEKQATTVENKFLYQDMECYKTDQQVTLSRAKK